MPDPASPGRPHLPHPPSTFPYAEAFARNFGWVTAAEQVQLRCRRVAIAGMGGVGGVHLLTLARLGVGAFHIADFDSFDWANFNRQIGAMVATVGRPKAEVLRELALGINPELRLGVFEEGLTEANLDAFFDGVDLYVDGLDFFAFGARASAFAACARLGIPAVTAAPLGMGAAVLTFMPGGMTFEEYFGWAGHDENEKALRFLVGLAPAGLQRPYLVEPSAVDLRERRGPSTVMACQICAGMAATEALKIFLRRGSVQAAPYGVQFDAYRNRLTRTWRPGGNRHPLQRLALAIGRRQIARELQRTPPAPADAQADRAPDPGDGALPHAIVEKVVAAAIAAPSADNRHHFRWSAAGDRITLAADDAFLAARGTHRGILDLLSLGAAVENASLAAAALGWRTDVDWLQPSAQDPRIAGLRLVASALPDDPAASGAERELAWAIAARHTNRGIFRGPRLADSLRAPLDAAAAVEAGTVAVEWLEGERRRRALRLIRLAETERFRRRGLHGELYDAIDFDAGWQAGVETGLAPAALGIERPLRPAFRLLRHWPLMRLLNALGMHRMLGWRAGWLPCRLAPGLGVVTVPAVTDAAALAAGRSFQRLWLRATTLGLALQPLAAAAVLRFDSGVAAGASAELRRTLDDGWAELFGARQPLMIFRLGRAGEPVVKSGRPRPAALRSTRAPD